MCFWCFWEALDRLRDFGSVLESFWLHFGVSGGLRGAILGVLGLHSGTLEVRWSPFWELWGSPERRGRLVTDPSGDRVANHDFFMTFSTHFGTLFGLFLGAKIMETIN